MFVGDWIDEHSPPRRIISLAREKKRTRGSHDQSKTKPKRRGLLRFPAGETRDIDADKDAGDRKENHQNSFAAPNEHDLLPSARAAQVKRFPYKRLDPNGPGEANYTKILLSRSSRRAM